MTEKPVTKEALLELFELIHKQDLKPSKTAGFDALYGKREEADFPEHLRVSSSKVEKSMFPHSWRRADPASKKRSGPARWVCTKCGGWTDFSAGTKPNGHATPTCADMMVDAVHDL